LKSYRTPAAPFLLSVYVRYNVGARLDSKT
jgi:hypothetical protein